MMLISSHFPIHQLKKGLRHVDFPFILAQYWGDKQYRDILQSFRNTFAIVDNGVHERSEPIPADRIADILDTGGGWKGILPDYIHKPIASWTAAIKTIQLRGLDLRHWGLVLHGDNPAHIQFQHDLAVALGTGVICFPYRSPRYVYLNTHLISFRYDQRYHLMGLSEADNLERYATLPGIWSLDSTKIWRMDLTQPGWEDSPPGQPAHETTTVVDFSLLTNNLNYLKDRFNAGITRSLSSRVEKR